ncbi:MAG: hypothetical protein RL684_2647 [Pseudomonadota bacterium]
MRARGPLVSRRDALAGIAGLALSCATGAPARGAAPAGFRLRLANAAGGLNLAMSSLMRQQGFFETFGLAVEALDVSDGTKILGAILGGSVDATFMTGFGQVFPAIERGAELRIIAGGALRPVLTLYSARPDVRSVHDLEGRVVGTGAVGALIHQLTTTLLRKQGVNGDKVRYANIGSNADVFRAVVAGTVDAGVGETALIDDAAHYGVHPLERGNMTVELPEFTYQAAWTSLRAISAKRGEIVRALAAYARLYRFVQQPEARAAFLRARRSVFPAAPEREHEAQWNFIQTYRPFASGLLLEPERLLYLQRLNVESGRQRTILANERVADMSLATQALQLLAATPGT